jgi:hypothetical protein
VRNVSKKVVSEKKRSAEGSKEDVDERSEQRGTERWKARGKDVRNEARMDAETVA